MELDSLQSLYGDEKGAILYLLPDINFKEQGAFEKWEETIENLAKCPFHPNEIRKCVCLESDCPQKGLICLECIVDAHVFKCKKVKRVEEVALFLQANEKILRENEDNDGEILKKILKDHPLPTLVEDFSSNVTNQYMEFLEKVQTKNVEKIQLVFEKGSAKNAEQVLSQQLDLIDSLTKYGENSSFEGMMELKESKTQLINKMDFLEKYLAKEMESFQDKMRAAIGYTFSQKTDINFEAFKENLEKKKPEFEVEEIQKDESEQQVMEVEEEEEKDSQSIQKSRKSLPSEQKMIKRLPHLPIRPDNYWPVTSDKKERIKFTPLRDRVQLLGFTQLKIVHFDNQVARLKVTLYEKEIEKQDQGTKLARAASLKDKISEDPILTQEIQIKPEENEESIFVEFGFPTLLKENHEYSLELTAVENFGFSCKYGLNNQRDLPVQFDDTILKFLPIRNEFELDTVKNFGGFITDETQGLFPSLIYNIIPGNLRYSSTFECPSC